ncbi:MAG: carboxypeptidase regulatory-like domain-containing protein, partial [Planctomycetota bacterium]
VVRYEHEDYRVLESKLTLDAKSSTHDMGRTVLERGPMIEGRVVDPDGAGVPAVIVHARSTDARGMSTTGGRGWASARTDDEGRFVLRGLNDGSYGLRVEGEGLFSERPTVAAGSAEVRILVKRAMEWRCRVVSGNKGIQGAWARAELPNRGGYLGAAMSNADGYFTMTGLPPDATFDLTLSHGDHKTLFVEGTTVSSGTAVHQLEVGGQIAGVVVGSDGNAVAEAQMRIYHHGKNSKWARTDKEGRFEISGLEDGLTQVEVNWTPEGHIPSGKIAVQLGDLDLRIEVKPGLKIEGHVVAIGEASLRSLRVSALDAEGKSLRSAWVWSDSSKKESFLLQGLPPGTYTVRVERMGTGVLAELPGVEAGATNLELEIPE